MLKRVITIILSLILAIGAFSGCGGGKTQESSENKKANDISAYEPIDGKEYTYSWVFYQLTPSAEKPYMKEYWEKKFGIKFDIWDVEQSQASEIINQRIIGGEIPDKFWVESPAKLKKYVEQDVVAELPMEVLEKYAPNILRHIKNDVPDALDYCKVDGKIYALPNFSMYPTRNAVAWRGDWLKNVGIDKVPETLDEFEEAMYKFAKEDPDGNGINDTYGLSNTAMIAVYGAYGYIPLVAGANTYTKGNWQERDGELVHSAIQPEMKEALAKLRKWYEDGVIDPEFITGENQGGYWAISHAFINGRIGVSGMGNTYHWAPNFYKDSLAGQNIEEMKKINPEGAASVVMGNPPIGPEGKRGTWANSYVKDDKYVFGAQLEDEPDKLGKLLQFLDYIYTDSEHYDTAYSGVAGEMYEIENKVSTNGKTYPVKVYKPEFADSKALNANFAHVACTMFSPSFSDEENYSHGPNWDWEYSVESDKYRLTNELLVSLESESKYQAELTKFVDETYLAIITGNKPLDYFEEFVEKWKQMGGETLTKEANEWYKSVKG